MSEPAAPRDEPHDAPVDEISALRLRIQEAERAAAERPRAVEEALEESRERYRALSEAAFEAIFISENGRCLEQNAMAAQMFGYADAEAVGLFGTEWIVPQDRDVVKRNMLSGYEQPYQVTALRKDGTTFPALLSGRMMHYRGRSVRVTSLRDISERKAAEETLRQSEERLRSILEHSPISMALVCMDGTIEYINREAIETFGYLPEDIPDMNRWWRLAYPDAAYRDEVVAQWMALLRQAVARKDQEIQRREYQVTCKDGTVKTTIIFGVLVCGKVFVMFDDITERTRAEEARLGLERQLLHAQKLESLGVLAGGVAHDFNNLLMAMLGNLDLALANLPPESPAAGNLHQAMAAARLATGLTNRMLAYSGRGAFAVEAMDLNAAIAENAAMLRAAIAKTTTLAMRLQSDLPPVIADAAQVQQVVMNLITNASESLGDQAGTVTLATGVQDCDERYLRRSSLEEKPAPGRFVWLEVADTGCGMSGETVLKLFDPFFTTKFAGRGLGMSAVLGIVRGHRGAIVVDSSPGAGTTIRVLFPVGAADRQSPRGPAPAAEATFGPDPAGLVLIVDDEPLVLSVCAAMVQQFGLRVLTAVDGADAVRVFRQEGASISAVLLDMTMPQLDGLATFREIRSLRTDVPVILCSGFSEQEIAERFAGEGLAGFLQKPYDLKGLRAALGRVLPAATGAAARRSARRR